ncbi:MAG: prophage LambdaSa2, endonuclease family protein [Chryseobacterium sp.]|jgi:hypothetical protein|nr:prophage LambdaSa2, endonuclease family protein [Chryseobacterium sp.]
MNENWKEVKGFEGFYEVSETGIVRTVERVSNRKSKLGNPSSIVIKSKVKLANLSKVGYLTIALVKENKTYTTYLHRIIAEAFVDRKKDEKYVVNHINGIKTDNRIENLEWVTSSQNNIHALDKNLRRTRKDVDEAFVNSVMELKNKNLTNKNIAELLNSTENRVQGITSERTYKRIRKS